MRVFLSILFIFICSNSWAINLGYMNASCHVYKKLNWDIYKAKEISDYSQALTCEVFIKTLIWTTNDNCMAFTGNQFCRRND